MKYYEGDSLESDGRTWEVVFATASPKCGRVLLLKSGDDDWALATDNLDGTIRDLESIEECIWTYMQHHRKTNSPQ